ncbi:MAG: patatin-like phospholipase family protein [Myxococcota bacterium]
MAISVGGAPKRLGLALSGGGFRAAAFHLGVFRALAARGWLWKVDLISCVSGGSIAGAFLAKNWGDDSCLDRFDEYLATQSLAVSTVLGGIFSPFSSRLDKLADRYDEDLFDGATLGDLPDGPRLYLNATNIASGNLFFFVTGGGKPAELGEWELGVHPGDRFRLARAVAASSAFPPVYPPLELGRDVYPGAGVEYVTLTDGGVYDNLGINPLVRFERNPLHYAIASDGGKPFEIVRNPTRRGTIVLKSAIDILMEQVRGLQFARLLSGFETGQGPKPLFFSIDSVEGEARPGDAARASAIGTNLKKLSDDERELLARHSSALMQARIARYAPELDA